ncbi:NACHT domain-containing protein [Maridesulfovibrio ferrireducens]|uniref:NACHT domain-containing protein n=1 Tax=Maridesulfovibrio ferrireducens TaxID=246191 RepID=A0A1G9JIT2_9BACT|nr:NACHT domain-containing protein [Maridesulfovibrio ferrireducens]SDL37507.1 NACHT domain-containing protein [Maridesulfovibrio ferrireducens]
MTIIDLHTALPEESFEKQTIKLLHKKLSEMNEADFTRMAVCPLFEALGYDVIDYNGGAYEGGKDVICWKDDEFGDPELTVIQVKKFKFTPKARSERNFSEVVTQLSQGIREKVHHSNGSSYFPNKVYLITPYDIDARSLQMRFEDYSNLKDRNRIKTLAGVNFVKVLIDKRPTVIQEILGEGHSIKGSAFKTFGNEDLLSALNYQHTINIEEIYSDLEFVFGGAQDIFFNSTFTGGKTCLSIPLKEWKTIKKNLLTLNKNLNCEFLILDLDTIEKTYIKNELDYKEKTALLNKIDNKIDRLVTSIPKNYHAIKNSLSQIIEDLKLRDSHLLFDYQLLLEDVDSLLLNISEDHDILEKYKTKINNIVFRVSNDKTEPHKNADLWRLMDSISKSISSLIDEKNSKKQLEKYHQQAKFKVEIDGSCLAKYLNIQKNKILLEIEEINNKNNSLDLKKLLEDVNRIATSTKIIFKNKRFRGVLCPRVDKNSKRPIMKISIHDVFNTKADLLVLGDAGAGKTTSLQMFARKSHQSKLNNELTLYLPLAKIFYGHQNYENNLTVKTFISQIASYFKSESISANYADLCSLFSKCECTLLLDGVDEVVKKSKGILEAVKKFKKKYSKTNVIISSRTGNYANEIEFLGVYLLPFSEGQRNCFIKAWFSGKEIDRSDIIIDHLSENSCLSELVRSPLLTTILCVLAESETPLPVNEIELYGERMRLLLGQYDIHKKIRRVTTTHSEREYIARKVAFILHNIERRYLEKKVLLKKLFAVSKYPKETVQSALCELIEPCNILVTMTSDGKIGFGHLRYQEYLAASELTLNRGAGIGKLMENPWWKGALVLFSQATDDISFLSGWIVNHGHVADVLDTYNAMIDVRSEEEQNHFRGWLTSYLENADRLEQPTEVSYENFIDFR